MDPANALDKNRRLGRTMRDLVALSTLPAVWNALGPVEIARSLADVLLNTLSLDLVYVGLSGTTGDSIKVARSQRCPEVVHDEAVNPTIGKHTGFTDAAGRTIRELVPDHVLVSDMDRTP